MVRIFVGSRRPSFSDAFATSSYALNVARPFLACTAVMAAVRVVLPWSTCPMVPTLMCGLVRSNFFLAMIHPPQRSTWTRRYQVLGLEALRRFRTKPPRLIGVARSTEHEKTDRRGAVPVRALEGP